MRPEGYRVSRASARASVSSPRPARRCRPGLRGAQRGSPFAGAAEQRRFRPHVAARTALTREGRVRRDVDDDTLPPGRRVAAQLHHEVGVHQAGFARETERRENCVDAHAIVSAGVVDQTGDAAAAPQGQFHGLAAGHLVAQVQREEAEARAELRSVRIWPRFDTPWERARVEPAKVNSWMASTGWSCCHRSHGQADPSANGSCRIVCAHFLMIREFGTGCTEFGSR